MRPVPRVRCRAITAVLLAVLTRQAARAATFEPEVRAEVGHSDVVYYVGEEPRPDWFAVGALLLPLRGEGPRNRWELSWEPAAFRHREMAELDHYEHRVRVAAESVRREGTSFAVAAGWQRSQEQGDPTSTLAGDLFLVPRSELDTSSFLASLRRERGARLVWNVEARAADSNYTPLPDPEADLPPVVLEDRREVEVAAGLSRLVSRATEVGLECRYLRYELDVTGDENDHLLSVTTRRRTSERTTVEGRVGVFRRELEPSETVEVPGDTTEAGIQAAIGLEHATAQGRVSVTGSHGPSSGGGLAGTSTDTVVGVRWGSARADRLRWGTGARWAMRDPTIEGDPTLRSVGAGGDVEWLPKPQIGLRLRADWVRQSGGDAIARNGSFLTASIGLHWYPLGATSRRGPGRR